MTKRVFVTQDGVEVRLKPVSRPLLDKALDTSSEVQPPTYQITTATGEVEVHQHDETTLETEEDKRAWEKYQEELKRARRERATRFNRTLIIEGVDVDPDADQAWKEKWEYLGIPIPENKFERKVEYVLAEVAKNELTDLLAAVLDASGINTEAVDQIRGSFRAGVQRATAQRDQA